MHTLQERRPAMVALTTLIAKATAAEARAFAAERFEDQRFYLGLGDGYRIAATRMATTPDGRIPDIISSAELHAGLPTADAYLRGLQAGSATAVTLLTDGQR